MHATHDVADELGHREVHNSHKVTVVDEFFHSRAADTIGVKNHAVQAGLREHLSHRHRRGCCVAQHGDGDRRRMLRCFEGCLAVLHHSRHRRCSIVENRAGNVVQAEDIDDRVHHDHVRRSHQRVEQMSSRCDR